MGLTRGPWEASPGLSRGGLGTPPGWAQPLTRPWGFTHLELWRGEPSLSFGAQDTGLPSTSKASRAALRGLRWGRGMSGKDVLRGRPHCPGRERQSRRPRPRRHAPLGATPGPGRLVGRRRGGKRAPSQPSRVRDPAGAAPADGGRGGQMSFRNRDLCAVPPSDQTGPFPRRFRPRALRGEGAAARGGLRMLTRRTVQWFLRQGLGRTETQSEFSKLLSMEGETLFPFLRTAALPTRSMGLVSPTSLRVG